MPIAIRDVLKVNVVLVGVSLLDSAEEIKKFSESVSADVEASAIGSAFGLPPLHPDLGRRLAVPRERVTLYIASGRTVIEREYPNEDDMARLADIAGHAIQCTTTQPKQPTAFGYNIELVFNQTSKTPAFQYLGDRLFCQQNWGIGGWNLIGGAGRLIFNSPEGRWAIQVEPRHNDETTSQVFVNLNLHKAELRLPSLDELRQSLKNVWNGVSDFVTHFDESVSV